MKHVISALVENKPAVLARVVGLISGRGYNIETLNVAPTQDSDVSRITMTVPGDDHILEQVTKQLNKLIDVIKVYDLTGEKFIDRELALVKVQISSKNRASLTELASLFKAQVVHVHHKSLTIQIVGSTDEIDNFLELVRPNGILEVSRTGVIALGRAEAQE